MHAAAKDCKERKFEIFFASALSQMKFEREKERERHRQRHKDRQKNGSLKKSDKITYKKTEATIFERIKSESTTK